MEIPVFSLLRRQWRVSTKKSYQVPPGIRVYAVGDVHGCRLQFEQLLGKILTDCELGGLETRLVILGDLVDRGPDSAGVIQRILDGPLPCRKQSFLMGNHEEVMLRVLNGDPKAIAGWLRHGGMQTLESYGISRAEVFKLGLALPRRLREVIPEHHIRLLDSFEDQVRIGDYLFVHAGVRPGIPLDDQARLDLRWIRDDFLEDEQADHGVMVVHGHTISDEPELRTNRIGIDTGCFASGRLTALVLEGAERRFLST